MRLSVLTPTLCRVHCHRSTRCRRYTFLFHRQLMFSLTVCLRTNSVSDICYMAREQDDRAVSDWTLGCDVYPDLLLRRTERSRDQVSVFPQEFLSSSANHGTVSPNPVKSSMIPGCFVIKSDHSAIYLFALFTIYEAGTSHTCLVLSTLM
jgi:hypothetical protein